MIKRMIKQGRQPRLVERNWRLVLNPQAIDREVKRHGKAS
jgi:hypothetical protein